jgi:hypothetical protein
MNEGSIFVLRALTDAAREWVAENVDPDAMTWGADGTVIEHRYVRDIVAGAQRDGLKRIPIILKHSLHA